MTVAPSALAVSDVAYLIYNPKRVDHNILKVFNESNLSVDLIMDKNVRSTDFSKYNLVFVSDDKLRNTAKYFDMTKYRTIIMNRFYGKEFGLTDSQGIY